MTLEELAQINLEERKELAKEYREEHYEILHLLSALNEALHQHRVKREKDFHRGYIGDLQVVRHRLDELVAFLETDKVTS